MLDETSISIKQHEDTRYHTVTWLHQLPNGGTEEVFCGQVNLAEEGEEGAGLWVSGHLPYGLGGFDSQRDAAKALALSRAERGPVCRNCGSYNLAGHEDPARYDGVSTWACLNCCRTWDRFTGEVYAEGTPQR